MNNKNRVYNDTRNSNMEKRINRAVSSAQKEWSDLLKDKRLLPPPCDMDSLTLVSWNVQGLGHNKFHKVKGLFNQELSS